VFAGPIRQRLSPSVLVGHAGFVVAKPRDVLRGGGRVSWLRHWIVGARGDHRFVVSRHDALPFRIGSEDLGELAVGSLLQSEINDSLSSIDYNSHCCHRRESGDVLSVCICIQQRLRHVHGSAKHLPHNPSRHVVAEHGLLLHSPADARRRSAAAFLYPHDEEHAQAER